MRGLAALRAACLAAVLAIGAGPARAQEAATLVADRVQVVANRTLVAQGGVEVLHKGVRLRASRIAYDRVAGSLEIEGPLVLTDDAGTVLLASSAALSDDLREGILTSARVVLDRQLQIAANEVQRLGGRHTVMSRAVASSCRVCETRATPLWEIRARRVVHDQQERQIH
ncbi:MAG: LPS-assembly protein LptD, partial [Gemmobacter sp.]